MDRKGVAPSDGTGKADPALRPAEAVSGLESAVEGSARQDRVHDVRSLSFFQTYGTYGVPIVLIALTCIGWTTFQMALTVRPNAMANYIMKTTEFDDGTFWLIIEPDLTLVVFSLLALGIVTMGYMIVLARMTLL